MSGLTSQPAINSIVAALKFSDRETGLDPSRMQVISDYWSGGRVHNVIADTCELFGSLPVAPWRMAEPADARQPERLARELLLPCVVKPVSQGSSIGMSIVHTQDELGPALALAFRHDAQVMVEEYVRHDVEEPGDHRTPNARTT